MTPDRCAEQVLFNVPVLEKNGKTKLEPKVIIRCTHEGPGKHQHRARIADSTPEATVVWETP